MSTITNISTETICNLDTSTIDMYVVHYDTKNVNAAWEMFRQMHDDVKVLVYNRYSDCLIVCQIFEPTTFINSTDNLNIDHFNDLQTSLKDMNKHSNEHINENIIKDTNESRNSIIK